MAQITRADAQAILVTGAKPQEAFWQDLMDSVIFKDEASSIGGSNGTIATQAEAEAGIDNVKVMSPLRTKQSVIKFAIDVLRDGVNTDGDTLKKLYFLIAAINQTLEDYYDATATNNAINNAITAITNDYYSKLQVDTLITNSNKTSGHIFGYIEVECTGITSFNVVNFGNPIITSVSGIVASGGSESQIILDDGTNTINYTVMVEFLHGNLNSNFPPTGNVIRRFYLNPNQQQFEFDYLEPGSKVRFYQIYN